MKSKKVRGILIAVLLFQSLWLAGCAAIQSVDDKNINNRYRRFYSGEALPRNEVAIFISTTSWGGGISVVTLDDGKEVKKIHPLRYFGDGELLPGHYKLCLRFNYRALASVGCVMREFDALPGHVYFIDENFTEDRKNWNPTIQDIGAGNDEDFSKIKIDGKVPGEKSIRSVRYIFNIAMRGSDWRRPVVKRADGYWD